MLSMLVDAHIPNITDLFAQHFALSYYQHPQELHHRKLNYDVLICRSNANINQTLIQNSQLKIIATASSGTEHIDLSALKRAGIFFISGHGANATAVCDYVTATLAYLLAQQPRNNPKMAIIGFGAVGRKIYHRFKQLSFSLGVFDPYIPSRPQAIQFNQLGDFDFICLHPNYHQQQPFATHMLFNQDILQHLSASTCIINAARGKVVDELAILHDFQGRYCSDVFWHEPHISPEMVQRCELATPHIAGHTIEAKNKIGLQLAQNIYGYFGIPWEAENHRGFVNTEVNAKNWQKLALAQYDPSHETKALKANPSPENFTHLRRLHHFRHDFPWMI